MKNDRNYNTLKTEFGFGSSLKSKKPISLPKYTLADLPSDQPYVFARFRDDKAPLEEINKTSKKKQKWTWSLQDLPTDIRPDPAEKAESQPHTNFSYAEKALPLTCPFITMLNESTLIGGICGDETGIFSTRARIKTPRSCKL